MGRSVISMQLERGGAVSRAFVSSLGQPISDEVFNELFEYFRRTGLPFPHFSERAKSRIFSQLCRLQVGAIIQGDIIKSQYCAIGLATSYFPHMWDVKCRHFNSVNESFADDAMLRKILKGLLYEIQKNTGGVSLTTLRSYMRFAKFTQAPSNFRPSAAKAIYDEYAKDSVVWDMSCGWGGRLLAALACPVKKYIGTDPSTPTFASLKKIASEIGQWSPTKVELHCLGSEVFCPKEPIDLCFTSPPYFNTERYTNEATQSYKKFSTIEKWVNGFLYQTIVNCRKCLRRDGTLILNVSPKLEKSTIEVAKRAEFYLVRTMQLSLAFLPGKNRPKRSDGNLWKYEPVLVFKKR